MRATNALLKLLRPKQWIKNGFVIAPLFFANQFGSAAAWREALLATLLFWCLSCAVYIVNDIRDVEEDRRHPVKRLRPLASGQVAMLQAILLACALSALALFLFTMLPPMCALIGILYLLLNALYTLYLKHVALVDIFAIASFYVLRVLMGCYALDVRVSPWIILTTFLLALFLGFGKRYHELGFEDYAQSKSNLRHYNRALIDRLVTITGGGALLAYAIYTTDVAQATGKVEIVYTVAFVAFGLMRYLQAIYVYHQGGEPESVILKDRAQLANMALWLLATLCILF